MKKIITFTFILILLLAFLLPTISCSYVNNYSLDEVETSIDVAFVGDILMMEYAQRTAQNSMNTSILDPDARVASGFKACFSKNVQEFLASADITFGNLENPIAEGLTEEWYYNKDGRPVCEEVKINPGVLYDNQTYRFNPKMIVNAHPALAYALKDMGFDIVSTANNHYADRASNGIDKTIDFLRKANLSYVGTIKYHEIVDYNNDGFPDNQAYIIKEVDGIKVAFLAFTSQINHMMGGLQFYPVFLNRLPHLDKICSRQVFCPLSNDSNIYYNVKHFCDSIKEAKLESDVVFVSLHAGIWHKHNPSRLQKKYVKYFTEAGADVIIGHHPHVIQPIEKIKTKNGNSIVFYSLGDFIGEGFEETNTFSNYKVGGIGKITILKDTAEKIKLTNISFTPTVPYRKNGEPPKIVFSKDSSFKKTEDIVDTVMNGTKLEKYLLTQFYLKKIKYGHIFIFDDLLPDHWILFKWKFEEFRNLDSNIISKYS